MDRQFFPLLIVTTMTTRTFEAFMCNRNLIIPNSNNLKLNYPDFNAECQREKGVGEQQTA